jgi:hypothetical protein
VKKWHWASSRGTETQISTKFGQIWVSEFHSILGSCLVLFYAEPPVQYIINGNHESASSESGSSKSSCSSSSSETQTWFQFGNSDLVPVWFLVTQIGTNGWLQVNLGSIHFFFFFFFPKNTDLECGSKYKTNYGPNSESNSLKKSSMQFWFWKSDLILGPNVIFSIISNIGLGFRVLTQEGWRLPPLGTFTLAFTIVHNWLKKSCEWQYFSTACVCLYRTQQPRTKPWFSLP